VLVVGRCRHHWWGGAGPLSLFVGWCWAIVIIRGVVMGHRLGGWWWALVAVHVDTLLLHSIVVMVTCCCHLSVIVVLCWVEIRRRTMIIRHPVATSLTWHLAPGLANSKGEGGLTSSLSIIWRPCRQLRCGNSGSCHHCLASMWPVVRFMTWHCHVGHHVMVVGNQRGGWWALWVAASKRRRW